MTVPDRLPAEFSAPAHDPTYPPLDRSDEISLAGLLAMLARRWRLIVIVGGLTALAAAIALSLQPGRYEAAALIMIDPREQRVIAPEQSFSSVPPTDVFVESEVEALMSRDLAERLVKALDLHKDPEFNPSPASTDRIPDRVAGAIEAHRRGRTNVIEVVAKSEDPQKAARLANGLVEVYLQANVDQNVRAAGEANAWLEARLAELREEVNAREAAADSFRAEAGLLTARGETLTEQQISEAQAAVLQARAALAETQARHQQVRDLIARGGSADAIAAVINSNVIRDLRAREADAARRRAELSNRYGELHPQLQAINVELEDIRRQIEAEIGRIAASLASEVEVARVGLANLEADLAASEQRLLSGNDQLVQLRQLEREAAAARAVYESFLERSHEIAQQGALNATRARLLSRATPPTSDTAPAMSLILLAALALGAVCGLIAALIMEQLDDTLTTAEDVERAFGSPPLASIPLMPAKAAAKLPLDMRHPAHYIVRHPLSSFAEAIRVVRAAIVYAPGQTRRRVVAITSALPGEGKTTLALSLARIAALSGERVILIDCDVRRRAINDLLNTAPDFGLLEVLAGQVEWRDVVGRDDETPAHILPLSTCPIPLNDLIGSAAMRGLMRQLQAEYDLIILDCAPVLAVAETRAIAAIADSVLLVGRWRKTNARTLANAAAQIVAAGGDIIGVALNAIDPRAPGRTSHADSLYYVDAKKAYYNA